MRAGVGVTNDAAAMQEAVRQSRPWRAMPTLTACTVAGLALVVVVGLQAPAHSVGLRWTPGPQGRTLQWPPLNLTWTMELADNGRDDSWPAWVSWALVTVVALLIAVGALNMIRRIMRRAPRTNVARTGADAGVPSEADARILQSGLAAAIEVLASDREPGNAVVQAWQGLEDAAASAGLHRRPAETTSEFTARILYRSRRSAAPIAVLLSLYQRVRFGEHSPTAAEIAAARDALVVLVDLWRADFPERRPARAPR